MNVASDAARQAIGQKPPASVSQIVPLHLRYWPMPTPKMHGTIPNTINFTIALCLVDELSILCPLRRIERDWSDWPRSTLGAPASLLEQRLRSSATSHRARHLSSTQSVAAPER